jgi:hypothetical protein
MAYFFGYRSMKRSSPLKIVFFLRFVQMVQLRFFVELTVYRVQHCSVATPNNHRIIQSMIFEDCPSRGPSYPN